MALGNAVDFAAWLVEQGYTLPPGAPSAAVLVVRGSNYINATYGTRFSGVPTGGFAQADSWPRTGAYAYGQPIGDSVIPDAVIKASYAAAWQEATSPGSLSAQGAMGATVTREKVDVIEVEYQSAASGKIAFADQIAPTFSQIEGLVRPFLTHDLLADAKTPIGLWSIG